MSNNSVDKGFSGRSSSYWTAGRWFIVLILLLFASIAAYIYSHGKAANSGYLVTQFSSSHIDQLNRILYNASIPVTPAPQIKTDPATADSTLPDSMKTMYSEPPRQEVALQICDDTCKINKALLYVRTEFDNKLQADQEDIIKAYISTFSAQEVGSYLAQLNLKVRSYFWLSGPFMYLEMIFWVIFGVICSNLFALGNLGRMRGFSAFSTRELPYQVAKFFYGPFCTIMLILLYNYIKHKDVVEVHATEGMIVFSFTAGLFSGRMMSFIERFKDVLLPENTRPPIQMPASGTVSTPLPVNNNIKQSGTTKPIKVKPTVVPAAAITETPITESAEEIQVINDLYREPEAPEMQAREDTNLPETDAPDEHEEEIADEEIINETPENTASLIPQAVITLNLDISGLYEEEKNEIVDVGFASAVVTMHNVNGKDVITARKTDDKYTASFVAPNVMPGIYIVRCTLTQKMSDDYIINLFGEKTAYVTNENRILELFIKKYEAID